MQGKQHWPQLVWQMLWVIMQANNQNAVGDYASHQTKCGNQTKPYTAPPTQKQALGMVQITAHNKQTNKQDSKAPHLTTFPQHVLARKLHLGNYILDEPRGRTQPERTWLPRSAAHSRRAAPGATTNCRPLLGWTFPLPSPMLRTESTEHFMPERGNQLAI